MYLNPLLLTTAATWARQLPALDQTLVTSMLRALLGTLALMEVVLRVLQARSKPLQETPLAKSTFLSCDIAIRYYPV